MNRRLVANYTGQILRVEGLFMLPALVIALVKGEIASARGFGVSIILALVLGTAATLIKARDKTFFAPEGFVTVAVSWMLMSLLGSLPFIISGAIPSFVDAIFETVSGFTTTGASILSDVEVLPTSILYWRSFTHWLGGMGVLVFLLAVVPLGRGQGFSMHILRAESPGPEVGKLVPKIRQTARILYMIYIVLTVLQTGMLLAGGMPLFDSVTTAFATAGTGGFSVRNASMAAYDSNYLQTVTAVFMMLFGVNFTVYHMLLLRDFKGILHNEELRLYLGIMLCSTAAVTLSVRNSFDSLGQAVHHAFFQVSSVMTTTGFATVDFNLWPSFARCLLIILMIVGASAGSTGGGIKVSRVLIILKSLRIEIAKLINPRRVKTLRMDNRSLDDGVVRSVNTYMMVYVMVAAAAMLLVSIDNLGFDTTISSVVACLNNIGPGFDLVGPTGNYGEFSVLSKLVLSATMMLGRLEMFPIILLFSPSVWRRSR